MRKGVVFTALAPGVILGYWEEPMTTVTPGVAVTSVAETAVAVEMALFFRVSSNSLHSLTSMMPLKLSPVRLLDTRVGKGAGTLASAAKGLRTPHPEFGSAPGSSMSMVVLVKAMRT